MVLLNNYPEVQSQGSPLVRITPDIYSTINSHINNVVKFIKAGRQYKRHAITEDNVTAHRAIYLKNQIGFTDCAQQISAIYACLTNHNPTQGVSFTLHQDEVKVIIDACIFIQNVFIDAGKKFTPGCPGYQDRLGYVYNMVNHLTEVRKYVSGLSQ